MVDESQGIVDGPLGIQIAETAEAGVAAEVEVLWPKSDIWVNMSIILTFQVVVALGLASVWNNILNPILVKLQASNSLIGFVNGASWATIPGCFFARISADYFGSRNGICSGRACRTMHPRY